MRVWTLSRLSISVLICLAVSALSLSAQGAPAGSKVILRVVGDSGAPVTDLKREEVTVRTDGKAREVKEVELVRVGGAAAPVATAPAPAAPPPSTLPPPFATNAAPAPAAAGGRQFLFIVDEDGIGAGREGPVREALVQMVAAATPADAFGLLSLRLVGGANIAPTTDRKVIGDALQKLAGTGSTSEPAGEMVCRAKRALLALNSVFNSAAPGLSLVIVSPGMLANPAGMTEFRRANQTDASQNELCQIRSNDLDDARNAVAASPANAYVFYYPEGLASSSNLTAAQQGIENVAGLVNADLMRIAGQADRGITRIMSETSSYYVVTLEDAPGPVRKVEARVTREGVKTQARLASARGPASSAAAKPIAPKDMLRVQTTYNDLPLRALGFVSRPATGNDLKLITLIESADPARKITAASVGVVDDKGVLKWQWTAQAAELGRAPIASALTVPPGSYRLRVAATDATGAAGTVDYALNANLAEGGTLKFGDMMLGVAQGGFAPRLQFASTDTQAVGLFEIYGAAKGAKLTVTYSLSETESGPPLGETPGNVQPGPGEAHTAFGGFGIETLQPGDYIMRATVSIDGKAAGSVTRTLRKIK